MLEILAHYFSYTIGTKIHEQSVSLHKNKREAELDFIKRINDYSDALNNNKKVMKTVFTNYKDCVIFHTKTNLSESEVLNFIMKELFSPSLYEDLSDKRYSRYELWTTFVKAIIATLVGNMKIDAGDIFLDNFKESLYDRIMDIISTVRTQLAYRISVKINKLSDSEIVSDNKLNNTRLIDENTKLKKQIALLTNENEKLKAQLTNNTEATDDFKGISINGIDDI